MPSLQFINVFALNALKVTLALF